MKQTPFLRPNLVKKETLLPYLTEIEESRIYSNFGPLNSRFEQRVLEEYYECDGAVTTVNNATIGLIAAISQCKRPIGKYVLLPSFTFAATPLAALWCGLQPYFVDIKPDDWCMDENQVRELVHTLGDQVAAIVPYATFGTNINLDFYQDIHESGIPVVVDAASSFGVNENNNYFGKGFPGCIVFSFHATKAFGVGEGGLLYSANKNLISQVRQAENFGFSSTKEATIQGINGKMSEYTAAIALSTLDEFPQKVKSRKQIYTWYFELLDQKAFLEKEWKLQKTKGEIPYQFMPICCPLDIKNDAVIQSLATKHIEARTYFSPPCHQQSIFKKYPHTPLTVTEKISRQILSLPLWEEMTQDDVQRIVEGLG
ncbi:DegT/DnrJ/EryC1/StrS family aminotransferase [Evansella sp. AB-rgal1]|uniref:DegT/DnrJ/EryC1/StrS family aminotransferase n=1 Tax=Evansella sp. AB-rgal1 TaxID=3242696 RepID=UPI00359D400F